MDEPQEAVPPVTGQSSAAAAACLRSVGFTVRTDATAVPSDSPAGTVARTNPPAGSRVSKGVEITLQISAGPAPRG
ncbi:hypothetical protein C5C31_10600 [Rathayibacter rathayi]|uniref:PASTA domain-containing protein n=1 Tax=Rathayibacter rathayi TaxID=33887 RepID=UPI000CE82CFB|nr:PASTA domain-containing protein [Rathayibacter rathayi]PPH20949.1 hypothetical protein C5C31_10600 [Rathayibacter rathayi]